MVERVIGNDEVTGPIPVPSSFDFKAEWLEISSFRDFSLHNAGHSLVIIGILTVSGTFRMYIDSYGMAEGIICGGLLRRKQKNRSR